MSNVVDQRIVKMQFDNSDFESNVAQSMSTLDKLRAKLNLSDTSAGLENVTSEVVEASNTTSSLGKAVDTVRDSFSAMEIIAASALNRITNEAITAGEQLVKSLSVDQIAEGWSKYDLKNSGVQTIMSATGKTVDEVMNAVEKLNWYTDETSYNYTDMISNIGKFTSAGIELDDAVDAMMGIANAAALSGQGISQASTAMYNFSQAMGTGAMLLQDWKSIENANMATVEFKQTLIDTALELGTLVDAGDGIIQSVTTDLNGKVFNDALSATENFNNSLSNRWLTNDVMIEALKKYSDYANEIYDISDAYNTCTDAMTAFNAENQDLINGDLSLSQRAFSAAQEAKTFTDAINSVKDAVSTGWMTSFETIFGNYEEAKTLWTEMANVMWDIFASGAEKRNEILANAFSVGQTYNESTLDTLLRKFNGITGGTDDNQFYDYLIEAAKELNGLADDFDFKGDMSWLDAKVIAAACDKMIEWGTTTKDVTEQWTDLEEVVKAVQAGDYGGSDEWYQKVKEAGYDADEVYRLLSKISQGIDVDYNVLTYYEEVNALTEEQIDSIRTLRDSTQDYLDEISKPSGLYYFRESIINVLDSLNNLKNFVSNIWNDVFHPVLSGFDELSNSWIVLPDDYFDGQDQANSLYNALEALYNFTEGLKNTKDESGRLRDTLEGVFSAVKIVATIIKDVTEVTLYAFNKVLKKSIDRLMDFTSWVGNGITKLSKWIDESGKLNTFVDTAKDVIDVVVDIIFDIIDAMADGIVSVKDLGEEFLKLEKTQTVLKNVKDWVKGVVDSFLELEPIQSILDKIKTGFENIKSAWDSSGFAGAVQALIDMIKNGIDEIKSYWDESWLSGIVQKLVDWITKAWDTAVNAVKAVKDWIVAFINQPLVQEWIQNVIAWFGDFKENASGVFGQIWTAISDFVTNSSDAIGKFFDTLLHLDQIDFSDYIKSPDLSSFFNDMLTSFLSGWSSFKENIIDKLLARFGIGEDTYVELSTNMEKLKTPLTSFFTWMQTDATTYFQDGTDALAEGATKALEFFTDNFTGFVAIGLGLISSRFLNDLAKFLEAAKKPLTSLSDLLDQLKKSAKNLMSSISASFKAKTFTQFAKGVLVMAAALFVIAMIDQDRLWESVAVLAVLSAVLLAVTFAIAKINNIDATTEGLGVGSLLGLAGSVWLIAKALEKVAALPTDKLVQSTVVVGLIGAFFTALVKWLQHGDSLSKGAGNMWTAIGLAVGMYVLVKAIEKFSAIDPRNMYTNLPGFVTLIFAFSKLVSAMGSMGKITNSFKTGFSLVAIVIALKMFVKVFDMIAGIDMARVKDNIEAFIAVFGTFGGLLFMSKFSGENSAKAGAGIMMMSVALLIIVKAMKDLARADVGTLAKATAVVVVIMAVFGYLEYMSKFAGENAAKAGTGILQMSFALVLVSLCVKMLSELTASEVVKGTAAVVALMIVFGYLELMSHFAGTAENGYKLLIALAACIGVMTICAAALSMLDTESLVKGVTALTVLMSIFSLMEYCTNFLPDKLNGNLIVLVVAVGLIGLVLGALSEMCDPNSVLVVATGLSEVLLALSGACWIISKCGDIPKLGQLVEIVVMMIAIMGVAVTGLSKIASLNVYHYMEMATALSELLLALSAACVVVSQCQTQTGGKEMILKLIETAVYMISLMGVVVGGLWVIDRLDIAPDIEMATALSELLLALASAALIVSKAGSNIDRWPEVIATGGYMVEVMGAVVLGLLAIDYFDLSPSIEQATSLSTLMLALAAACWVVSKAGDGINNLTDLKMIAGEMVAVMVTVVGSLALMDKCNIEASLPEVIAMGTLMMYLAAACWVVSKCGDVGKSARIALVEIGAATEVLAGVLTICSDFVNVEGLVPLASAVGVLMLELAGALWVASQCGDISSEAKWSLGVMAGACSVMTGVLTTCSNWVDAKGLIPLATAVGTLMLVIAAALWIVGQCDGKIPGWKNLAQTLGVMEGALAGIATILGAIQKFEIEPNLETVIDLAILMIALSAACLVVSLAGTVGKNSEAGIKALAETIGAFAGLFALFGGLNEYLPDLVKFIQEGIPILNDIAYGIGEFVGNLIGGLIEGTLSFIPALGTMLSEFVENSKSFFEFLTGTGTGTWESLDHLTNAFYTLTKADMLDGIARFLNLGEQKSLAQFGEELSEFAEPFASFCGVISQANMDPDKVAVASECLSSIITAAGGLAREGGIWQDIIGEAGSLADFGLELAKFAPYFVIFCDIINSAPINEEVINKTTTIAESLIALKSNLPETGGWLQTIFGEAGSLKAFGKELASFAPNFVKYSKAVENVDVDAIAGTQNAAEMLVSLKDSLCESGGWWQNLFGEKDLSKFGEELESFGFSLKTYSDYLKNVSASDIEAMNPILQTLIDMSKGLDSVSWWKETWSTPPMTAFGQDLAGLGPKLQSFAGNVSSDVLSLTHLRDVTEYIYELIELMKEMRVIEADDAENFKDALYNIGSSGITRFLDAFEEKKTAVYDKGAEVLTSFKNGFNSIVDDITGKNGIFQTLVNNALAIVDAVIKDDANSDGFKKRGKTLIEVFVKGIIENDNTKSTFESIISTIQTYLDGISLADKGESLVRSLCVGMNDVTSVDTIQQACRYIISVATNQLDASDVRTNFETVGGNWSSGLAIGMLNKQAEVQGAATSLANTAIMVVADDWDEHSPSKVSEQLGNYFVDGIVRAFQNGVPYVEDSTEAIGDAAVNGLNDSLVRVAAALDEGIDFEPTITPILDLSNVEAGANEINDLMSGKSMNLASDVASVIESTDTVPASELEELKKSFAEQTEKLGSNFSSMTSSLIKNLVGNMKVYLDGKTLVGEIAPQMDQQLGKITKQKLRGV